MLRVSASCSMTQVTINNNLIKTCGFKRKYEYPSVKKVCSISKHVAAMW